MARIFITGGAPQRPIGGTVVRVLPGDEAESIAGEARTAFVEAGFGVQVGGI
jgi:hypothetical protein